jgi:hypothetical protein
VFGLVPLNPISMFCLLCLSLSLSVSLSPLTAYVINEVCVFCVGVVFVGVVWGSFMRSFGVFLCLESGLVGSRGAEGFLGVLGLVGLGVLVLVLVGVSVYSSSSWALWSSAVSGCV